MLGEIVTPAEKANKERTWLFSFSEFEIAEEPEWREPKETTTKLLEVISQCYKDYATLPQHGLKFLATEFIKRQKVRFVVISNKLEDVGTTHFEDVSAILEKNFQNKDLDKVKILETLQTFNALEYFKNIRQQMITDQDTDTDSVMLTEQLIKEGHHELLSNLHKDAGEYRTSIACTHWKEETHYYSLPEMIPSLMESLIDKYNHLVQHLPPSSDHSTDALVKRFRLAAWLMFHFVNIHPFGDGNGRLCRILANHVLSPLFPFPVIPFHNNKKRNRRSDYIEAIVACRNDPKQNPSLLAALLVDRAVHVWRNLFHTLRNQDISQSSVLGLIRMTSSSETEAQDPKHCDHKDGDKELAHLRNAHADK